VVGLGGAGRREREGSATLEFLDETGKVVQRLPEVK